MKRTGKKIREILSILETEFIALPSHWCGFLWFVFFRLWDGEEQLSGWICRTAVPSAFISRRWFSTLYTSLGWICYESKYLVLFKFSWPSHSVSIARSWSISNLSSNGGRRIVCRRRKAFIRTIELLIIFVVHRHIRKIEFSEAVFSEVVHEGELQSRKRWVTQTINLFF